mmetsp:Transcript_16731/g.33457  ORF Transcript_16731/g.33457 Transcript_16731/m.33457 type:complete len:261 (-) Transcript_16731:51-833(-)
MLIVLSRVVNEAAPSAANVKMPVRRLQPDFGADEGHLVVLHLLERLLPRDRNPAGVHHAVAEEAAVEVILALVRDVSSVVVVLHLLGVLLLVVREELGHPLGDEELEMSPDAELEGAELIPVGKDVVKIGVAEVEFLVEIHLEQRLHVDPLPLVAGCILGILEIEPLGRIAWCIPRDLESTAKIEEGHKDDRCRQRGHDQVSPPRKTEVESRTQRSENPRSPHPCGWESLPCLTVDGCVILDPRRHDALRRAAASRTLRV